MQQCRCVSKSWYNLIQLLIHTSGDLYLAKTHLNRLLGKNHHSKFWTMASSSNGLICSAFHQSNDVDNEVDSSYMFYIYNPYLRQYVTLPKLMSVESNTMAFGFGYVPSTGEYKVVRIFYPVGFGGDSTVGNVEVYTLGKISSSSSSSHPCVWRSKGNIEHRLQVSSPGVLVDGSLHWLTEKVLPNDQKVKQHDILAFDLLEEEFYSVPLPPSEYLTNFQIKELGGCLCGINNRGERRMQMWIMEDYHMKRRTKESSWNWKSVFRIIWTGLEGLEECLYWNKPDQALLWYNSSSLVHMDIITSSGPNLAGKNSWPPRVFHGLPHIKSFVSLKALGEDDVITIKTEKINKKKALPCIRDRRKGADSNVAKFYWLTERVPFRTITSDLNCSIIYQIIEIGGCSCRINYNDERLVEMWIYNGGLSYEGVLLLEEGILDALGRIGRF